MTSYEDQMEQQADGEFTAELRARQVTPTFRVEVSMPDSEREGRIVTRVTSYVRYGDAASMFWTYVQLMPDDGWDTFQGAPRPADSNPYDLDVHQAVTVYAVEELRQLLDGVDGDRLVYVQVLAARREAVRTYSENGSRMVGNPITDEARLEYTRAFIISA